MIKFLTCRFNTLVVSFVLLVGVMFGLPNVAVAKPVAKSVSLDPANAGVNVAAIYDTSLATQKSVIKSLKSSKSLLSKAPGFESLSVLKSEDGTRVIFLSQWQDLASYQTYSAQPTEGKSKSSKSKESKDALIAPPRTVVFKIEKTQAADEGITPAIRGKEAVIQFSEFTVKNPDDQPKVIASVEKMMPNILLKKPAPQATTLLSSVDNTDVALLANWNCTADFEDTGSPAAFDEPDAELVALADNDQRLYDVVQIMSAKTKESKESKDFKEDKESKESKD